MSLGRLRSVATQDFRQRIFKARFGVTRRMLGAKPNVTVRTDENATVLVCFTQARPVSIKIFGVGARADYPAHYWQTGI
jgi:hypothetical protein